LFAVLNRLGVQTAPVNANACATNDSLLPIQLQEDESPFNHALPRYLYSDVFQHLELSPAVVPYSSLLANENDLLQYTIYVPLDLKGASKGAHSVQIVASAKLTVHSEEGKVADRITDDKQNSLAIDELGRNIEVEITHENDNIILAFDAIRFTKQ
jgi:hypothetical protein